ncbi:hypothetical protein [Dietzia natronolimnaea]|nr:hypothetical protein [Dietzia natronolimnaea]
MLKVTPGSWNEVLLVFASPEFVVVPLLVPYRAEVPPQMRRTSVPAALV